MSSSDYAIRIKGIGKQYRLGLQQSGGMYKYKSLGDTVSSALRSPLKTLKNTVLQEPMNESNSFWALKDVSFDVKKGEVVGIIGRNGAGKSTLLKILSRITRPTTGEIELHGRVGSLLEVGTGFHPELSGRENIYLNGAVLGMTRGEVKMKFDEIVDFSEIEKFLDTPVKQYSSGMYTRLAFAVAAHLDPEILVVDEVLAVGDVAFQRKCLRTMKDVSRLGRTVLLVSHNLEVVSSICSRVVLLADGRVHSVGITESVLPNYLAASNTAIGKSKLARSATEVTVRAEKAIFDPNEVKRFAISVYSTDVGQLQASHISAHVVSELGNIVGQCDSRLVGLLLESRSPQYLSLDIRTPWLKPGDYSLDIFICSAGSVEHHERVITFSVAPVLPYEYPVAADGTRHGPVLVDFKWRALNEHESDH